MGHCSLRALTDIYDELHRTSPPAPLRGGEGRAGRVVINIFCALCVQYVGMVA